MVLVVAGVAACGDNGDGTGPPPDAAPVDGPTQMAPPVTLQSIAITPTAPSIAAGTSVQLIATGFYSDTTTADVSAMVTWSSSAEAIATVSPVGVFAGLTVGTTTVEAKLAGVTGSATATVTAATLLELQVTPSSVSLALGTTKQLTATGVFSDNSTQDLSAQVSWTSSATAFITVSPAGLVTALAIGDAVISATLRSTTATATVNATAAVATAVTVAPVTGGLASIALGRAQQLVATATFSDNTTQDITADATWSSSDDTHAAVDATGRVTSHGLGVATITAAFQDVRGSLDITVTDAVLESIDVTSTADNVAAGVTVQFTATGVMSDGTRPDLTTQVIWTPASDNPIAVVSNAAPTQGLATTLIPGDVLVTATLGEVSGSHALHVADAVLTGIDAVPVDPTLGARDTLQFHAIGHYTDGLDRDITAAATWTSDDDLVATISNEASSVGLAHTVSPGTTTIHAANGLLGASSVLTVTPAVPRSITVAPVPSLAAGLTVQLIATVHFNDDTSEVATSGVIWASADPAIATVSAAGLVTGVAAGSVVITASSAIASVTPGSVVVVVDPPVLNQITVTPGTASVVAGQSVQFTATGVFTNGTRDITAQVDWAPASGLIAAVSAAGLATTTAAGSVTVTATLAGQVGSAELIVGALVQTALDIVPVDPTIGAHDTLQFQAVATFNDGSHTDVTASASWLSSIPAAATIVATGPGAGLASGGPLGETEITATFGGFTATSHLTVTEAVLLSIAISPTTVSVAKGLTTQFIAIASYDDDTTSDLSGQVMWSSLDPTVARVSATGAATTLAVGTTTITAAFAGVTSNAATLTVTAPVTASIAVTPSTVTLTRGGSQQLTAIATLTDGKPADVTPTALWRSDDVAIATVSATGLVTAVAGGTAQISAAVGEITDTATITVVGPSVTTTLPRNAEVGIRDTTPISVTFSQAIVPASLTTQSTAGACTGSLQLSRDNFASCVAFVAGRPSFTASNTVVTATVVGALAAGATYRIRVLGTVVGASGDAIVAFTQATGFTTVDTSGCANRLVISQVYGAGGNAAASPFNRDFIELHNGGSTPVNLADFAVQFAVIGATTWQRTVLPAATIPPGGYFLIAEAAGANGSGAPLAADATGAIIMATGSGKVALTPSAVGTLPAQNCPVELTYDLVGYGGGTCSEGTATASLGNTIAALRGTDGCADADVNATDFALGTPAPRNSATPPRVCTCR